MVIFLLLSIISATLLLVILKKFSYWKIDTLHGIIINYWVAATLSFMISPSKNYANLGELITVWPVAAIIGCMFILVFFIIAKTTQTAGVAVASVASKMSMVIPIGAGIILYNESFGMQKAIGILIAIPAVIITSIPTVKSDSAFKFSYRDLALPGLLFLGAGLVDTAIKFAQHFFMNDTNKQLVIMSIFGFAGLIGTLRLIFEMAILKKKLLLRSVAGGILLGVVNYYSLYFLLQCLAAPGSESSTIFAFVNIGVVITSFLAGLWLFSEQPNRNKLLGIGLSVIAIFILSYSGK